MTLARRQAPYVVQVTQRLPTDHVPNVRAETRQRLLDAGLKNRIKSGARVAITAGSRGMGGFVDLVSGAVDAVKAAGGSPFIIPAMGSHGGAVREGQVEVLRRLGTTEEVVGAPVEATMETLDLGPCKNGARAHLDKIAAAADGVIVLARVKTHPESSGPLASGLLKMVTIGLGKQAGAQEAHSHGLWDSIRQAPELIVPKARVLFGVAVVENGYRQPVAIEAVPGTYDAFLEADERLLRLAKQHLSTLPFKDLDVLVIDEIGKNISGTCMDPHVIGHWRIAGTGEKDPDYRRIAVLSLSHPSLGNGLGVGAADFTTARFAREYDPAVTYVNMLTATEPGSWNSQEGLCPSPLPSDREAIEVALYSALSGPQPRLCRIRSTETLDHFWVSPALLGEVKANPALSIEGEAGPLPFDPAGNLF